MKTFRLSCHSLIQLGHLEGRPRQRLQNPSLFPLIQGCRRLKKKSPNSKKDSIGLHKSRNVPLKQQRPRSFDKNQFTIFHTKAFSRRKLAILFDFFPNLAVQQTTSMTSFLLYSTQ